MTIFHYGNPDASLMLIQPVDDHDLSFIDREVEAIQAQTHADFHLIAAKVGDWNRDLAPWTAPPVFGKDPFGDGAGETLKAILPLAADRSKAYLLGGYSLAGLFSLWAAIQTDAFSGVAAASPSVWYPGFTDYMRKNPAKCPHIYLSLGDKEEKTRNPVMAAVGGCIRECFDILNKQNVDCALEWNPGNHFRDPEQRTARAFSWLIERARK